MTTATIDTILENNTGRKITNSPSPPSPPEYDDNYDGDRNPRNYSLALSYKEFSGKKPRSGVTTIEIMPSEIKFPLDIFLRFAIINNPTFDQQLDGFESYDEYFGDALFGDVRNYPLPKVEDLKTKQDQYHWMDLFHNAMLRDGGFRCDNDLFKQVKNTLSDKFHLIYHFLMYKDSENIEFNKETVSKLALENQIPLDIPIENLRVLDRYKKYNNFIIAPLLIPVSHLDTKIHQEI